MLPIVTQVVVELHVQCREWSHGGFSGTESRDPFLYGGNVSMGEDLNREPGFLVRTEQVDLADFPQIHPDRIVGELNAFQNLFAVGVLAGIFLLQGFQILLGNFTFRSFRTAVVIR